MEKKLETKSFEDKSYALNFLMLDIYQTLGNGDGENDGEGSLWRCAKEIYDWLNDGIEFSYADCEWQLIERDNEYIACCAKYV